MTAHPLWHDDYYLLLFRIVMRAPEGVKAAYSRPVVQLALRLHIPPEELRRRMFEMVRGGDRRYDRLKKRYEGHRRALAADIARALRCDAFGSDSFYDGVEAVETFEADFRPIAPASPLMPVTLIILLDLYFRLVPATMRSDTPEVRATARRLGIKAALAERVLRAFMRCDAYMVRSPLLPPDDGDAALRQACCAVWRRYGNDPERLADTAAQMAAYYER